MTVRWTVRAATGFSAEKQVLRRKDFRAQKREHLIELKKYLKWLSMPLPREIAVFLAKYGDSFMFFFFSACDTLSHPLTFICICFGGNDDGRRMLGLAGNL